MKFRFAAVLCGALAGSAYGQALFGVASFNPTTPQALYSIDTSTGAATVIGSTGLININDIAWNPTTQTMYALTTSAELYSLDLSSGAATLIGANLGIIPEGGLTFDAAGALYATNGDALASVNAASGALTAIGPFGGTISDVSGLAPGSAGTLIGYAKNGLLADQLVSISSATGAATLIGETGLSSASGVGGLARNPFSGELLLSDHSGLFSVNELTGAATPIGAHGVSGMSGIAFIPEPGSLTLLALLSLGLIRRAR